MPPATTKWGRGGTQTTTRSRPFTGALRQPRSVLPSRLQLGKLRYAIVASGEAAVPGPPPVVMDYAGGGDSGSRCGRAKCRWQGNISVSLATPAVRYCCSFPIALHSLLWSCRICVLDDGREDRPGIVRDPHGTSAGPVGERGGTEAGRGGDRPGIVRD